MKFPQKIRSWFLITGSIVALAALAYQTGLLQPLEWKAVDALQKAQAQVEPLCPDLSFIVLDQRSLEAGAAEFGLDWPWPREAYRQTLEFLQKAGARVVLFDFLFTENASDGPTDKALLAQAIKNQGHVYLGLVTKTNGVPKEDQRLFQVRPDLTLPIEVPSWRGDRQKGVSLSLEPFMLAAAGAGDVRLTADADGVTRRIRPLVYLGERLVPHLGFAPVLQGAAPPPPLRVEPRWLRVGDESWPLDARGNLLLRYPGDWKRYPKTSMIDIITSNQAQAEGSAPAVNPALFKDRVVVIGSTALSLMDLRATPLSPDTPGFYITAAAWAAAVYHRVYSDHSLWVVFWASLVLLAGLGAWAGWKNFWQGMLIVGAAAVLFVGLGAVWFWFSHALVFLVTPVAALVGAFGLSTGLSYRTEQRQKRFIQGAFVQVLSPSVLERLMQEPERLAAGGEQAELTIYFSDLAGFTKFSERLKPHELVQVLNRYLSDMVATIVDEYQGYVDKFIGDAVMAFWGAPVPDADHAFHACAAALRNQEKLRALQPELAALGLDTEMRMRIGLHTGHAIAGMMGSVKKLNYTVMGDAVNLASRLEGVNKFYETSMLISQETNAALAGRLVTREIDLIRVKGKLAPTRIYELVAEPGRLSDAERDFLSEYRAGLEAYGQRQFKQARLRMKQALRLKPGDFPAMMYLKRCAQYLKKAPGRHWDGVTVMEGK